MPTSRLLASLLGVGFLRPGPGTWGSMAVLPAALLGGKACLILALLLFLIGLWAVDRAAAEEDPGWIVIDEGCGMCLALAAGGEAPGPIFVICAFAAFRLLDIFKPWPVSWADKRKGALWVMLDDVLAGAIAAGILLLAGSFGLLSR